MLAWAHCRASIGADPAYKPQQGCSRGHLAGGLAPSADVWQGLEARLFPDIARAEAPAPWWRRLPFWQNLSPGKVQL